MNTLSAPYPEVDSEIMVKRLLLVAELLTKSKANRKIIKKSVQKSPDAVVRYLGGTLQPYKDAEDATEEA